MPDEVLAETFNGEIKLSKWQNHHHVALSFRLEEAEERLIERGGRGSIIQPEMSWAWAESTIE